MPMNLNAPFSDQVHNAAQIDPDVYAAGAQSSGWVDMGSYEGIMAAVLAGDLDDTTTLTAKLEQAKDASGTGAKDIDDKSIELDGSASPSESNNQIAIECRSEELDVSNDFTHVRLTVTTVDSASPAASSDFGAIVLGFGRRYAPTASTWYIVVS